MIYEEETGRLYRLPRKGGRSPREPKWSDGTYVGLYAYHEHQNYRAMAHAVVWEFFKGPLPDGLEINHKNGCKRDNRISNLEAVTHSENVRHGHELKRIRRFGERYNELRNKRLARQ